MKTASNAETGRPEGAKKWLLAGPRAVLLLLLLVGVPLIAVARAIILFVVRAKPRRDANSEDFDVICFSHVSWRHIWQRNHHTMSRLARNHRVFYLQVFGPSYIHVFAKWAPSSISELRPHHPDVQVRLPLLLPGESRIRIVRSLNRCILTTYVRWLEWRHGLSNTVLWYYFPAASYVIDSLKPAAVVYDVQDEYTAFAWAPRDIAQREAEVLQNADVLFGGTYALYERKREQTRAPAHFFPCGVEFDHFHSAAPDALCTAPITLPAELQNTSGPRLFYMGLVDARIDGELLAYVADHEPTWSLVLAGPVDFGLFAHFDELRRRPNVLFLGKMDYRRLPEFIAHSDVLLMPWHVNELTLHINPTKTLEYMAAQRPVVSIALPDLTRLFSDSVALATTHDEFVEHCREALAQTPASAARVAAGLEQARIYSWERVVQEMEQHVRDAMKARQARASG